MLQRSVVAVGAHPGDVDYFAGATLARFASEGARVVLVVCSDAACGAGGGAELAGTRRAEARRAAAVIGAQELFCLPAPAPCVAFSEDLVRALVREIRRHRAELVLAHDPTTLWARQGACVRLGQSAHRAAGRAALEAVHPGAEFGHLFPEIGDPWLVPELWLFDTDAPDHFVDADPTWELKRAMLGCHASQLATRWIEDATADAEALRRGSSAYAEGFRRLRLL